MRAPWKGLAGLAVVVAAAPPAQASEVEMSSPRIDLPARTALLPAPPERRAATFALPALRRSSGTDRLDRIRRSMRQRETGLYDVYAHGDSGLRFSGGGRFHKRFDADNGTRAGMRLPGGAVALRNGYESYAPVALVGYDMRVSERLKVGVEGGMMAGRQTAIFGTSALPGEMTVGRSTRNPVADVVMTLQF